MNGVQERREHVIALTGWTHQRIGEELGISRTQAAGSIKPGSKIETGTKLPKTGRKQRSIPALLA
jgi:hypothetical protein